MSAIPKRMKQLQKGEGVGNMIMGVADTPTPGPRQVLVRQRRSLISRGSEIGRRYRLSESLDPSILGYSSTGDVVAVGPDVDPEMIGQRFTVIAPHAEYVIGDIDSKVMNAMQAIPDDVSYERAAFAGLAGAGIIWTDISAPKPDEVVVVMGLGLIGNFVLQAVRKHNPAMLIGVDGIDARCELAESVGADVTINIREHDPVARVKELTGGKGAHLVMECVGGPAGVKSFPQALDMTRKLGRVHLISLYQEQPLPLDSGAIQGKMVYGGYFIDMDASDHWWKAESMRRVTAGEVEVDKLHTHTFKPEQAREAYDLLHDRLAEAMGVLFDWD
ncbi:MAG: zinc-binding dehydrogenase [Thermomicrobiales bacterium]|nr:zinc-binding dehydrogenase [Thermomicrobiales bacterium]